MNLLLITDKLTIDVLRNIIALSRCTGQFWQVLLGIGRPIEFFAEFIQFGQSTSFRKGPGL